MTTIDALKKSIMKNDDWKFSLKFAEIDAKNLNIPIEFENRYNDLVKNYDSYIDNEEDEIMFNNPLNYTRKAVIDKANKKQYALNYKKL